MELDLDGDGIPDVMVPGIVAATPPIVLHPGRGTAEVFEAILDYDRPPITTVLTPMGQIDNLGYALRSRTARTGWRRTFIVVVAWLIIATLVLGLVAGLLRQL